MNTSCNIIYDLLPLYIDGICSKDSTTLIEEHLKECPSCSAKYRAMKNPLESDAIKPQGDDSAIDNFNANRAFVKIRRRWVASILITVLMLPIFYLGINAFRGEGVSFTNIYGIYRTNSMLAAFESGDYEKTFSYLDVAGTYKEIVRDINLASPVSSKEDFEAVDVEGTGRCYINTKLNLQIPEKDFEETFLQLQKEQRYYLDWLSQFEGKSYEEFYDLCENNFFSKMSEWKATGAAITGYRFKTVYNNDGLPWIEFYLYLANKEQSYKYSLAFIDRGKGKLRLGSASRYSPVEMKRDELLDPIMEAFSIYVLGNQP